MSNARWPELPFIAWADTAATLQLWTQVVGKIRLARTPWLNHSWHVTLYVSARGLTTGPIPDGARSFQIDFDFIDHVLWIRTSDGHYRQVMLASDTGKGVSVAKFYGETMAALSQLGIAVTINTMPCELAECTAFEKDVLHRSYDAEAVGHFFRVLVSVNDVLTRFRTGFLGKSSPVHFFWGSFDLAVTRFSGRTAPAITLTNMMGEVSARFDKVIVRGGGSVPGIPCWIEEIRPVDVKAVRQAQSEMRQAGTAERTSSDAGTVGMPNPAAAHCAKLGGVSIARTATDGGQSADCKLPDGQQCDEWTLFREGKCPVAATK